MEKPRFESSPKNDQTADPKVLEEWEANLKRQAMGKRTIQMTDFELVLTRTPAGGPPAPEKLDPPETQSETEQ